MLVYFHPDFLKKYAYDPAAEPGRLEPALEAIEAKYPIFNPHPATKEDVLLVHSQRHWDDIAKDNLLHHTALLAAGSAIAAADSAFKGEQAFALCRPPGHHASADSCWGFCYYNNIAIAVSRLLERKMINTALIVDIDLHYGDGTANIFQANGAVTFWHIRTGNAEDYIKAMENDLNKINADIVAVSAGFDRGLDDWGGMLSAADYQRIGSFLGYFARQKSKNRLFAALEGGYNPQALAHNVLAFIEGVEENNK